MPDYKFYLLGKDLRSIGRVEELLPLIVTQEDFDTLFAFMLGNERLLVMRAVDAVEKITRTVPHYLESHKEALLERFDSAREIELKWHMAILVTRVDWMPDEVSHIWQILATWALDTSESRIVRVNALQALFDLNAAHQGFQDTCEHIFRVVRDEGVPAINARLRKLR